MPLVIPDFLSSKLAESQDFLAITTGSIADFEPWLATSGTPFFPDYSDHGPNHIRDVLISAVSIMTDDAQTHFSPGDSAALILATILHDSALHLSEEGFFAIIDGRYSNSLVEPFDVSEWPNLWDEFLFESKRWDTTKLRDVFGESDSGLVYAVREPPRDKTLLDLRDRLLIGEFIRRHHPRMAHEFALNGVPGVGDERIRLDSRLGNDIANVIGLVARSHGMSLRSCVDYLETVGGKQDFQSIHATFLMVLLRIADYLQIQAERVPKQMLKIKQIKSPISVREWNAHLAVKNVHTNDIDPEAIRIHAEPIDLDTFLRLREWLNGIQMELDSSWAVLGEIYGRFEGLSDLGLVIRRVRSNLDNSRVFSKTIGYVPEKIKFDVAQTELLKLLVRPLYGDKPEIGVRELIQNATDAVRERRRFEEKHGLAIEDDSEDVVVSINEHDAGQYSLVIEDKGIGMTLATVRDYFLNIGASFRASEVWQKEFESEEPDEESGVKSQVVRAGRFGIGALAVFLIGDEIEVRTRHITSDSGVSFSAHLDERPIQLNHEPGLPIGTSIKVDLKADTYEKLKKGDSWDWFCFEKPKVIRTVTNKGKQETKEQRLFIPSASNGLPKTWRSTSVSGYESVLWSFKEGHALCCNGIKVVGNRYDWGRAFGTICGHDLGLPNLSIIDPDGNLPLNLQRSDLASRNLPFHEELKSDVLRDFMAHFLVNLSGDEPLEAIVAMERYNGLGNRQWGGSRINPFFATRNGIGLTESWNLHGVSPNRILVLNQPRRYGKALNEIEFKPPFAMDKFDAILLGQTDLDWNSRDLFIRFCFGYGNFDWLTSPLVLKGVRFITSRSVIDRIQKKFPKYISTEISDQRDVGDWVVGTWKECGETAFDLDALSSCKQSDVDTSRTIAAEWFIENWKEPSGKLPNVVDAWKDTIGEFTIPLERQQRKIRLDSAYNELKREIELWQGES